MTPAADPTIVVELTPAGRAAVAVVLVAGPGALGAVGDCFIPASARPLADLPIRRIALGRWGAPGGEELIVCRRAQEQIEIHCHGGAASVRAVVDALVVRGCRRASWQDWLRGASPDPLQAAAQIALAGASTARTAGVLLDQYHGALTRAIQDARQATASAEWVPAAEIVEGILTFRDLGLHLTTAWRVVLAGAPNVGKSSLINAIAGYRRAIVSPLPGTTRDVVTVATAIDGWPVQLADTAGLRGTRDELESAGVALAGAAIAEADLVLLIMDASAARDPDPEVLSRSSATARLIHVWNKIDLLSLHDRAGLRIASSNPQSEIRNPQLVSALTGEGVPELVAAIGESLLPIAPPTGAAVAFTDEQIARLEAARIAIHQRDAFTADAALNALLAGEQG